MLFQTKNSNLGKFWRAFECKILVNFVIIWNMLRPFGIIFGRLVCCHLVYFPQFGMFGGRKIWQPWFRPPQPRMKTSSPFKTSKRETVQVKDCFFVAEIQFELDGKK
jgi:hypothetical protein